MIKDYILMMHSDSFSIKEHHGLCFIKLFLLFHKLVFYTFLPLHIGLSYIFLLISVSFLHIVKKLRVNNNGSNIIFLNYFITTLIATYAYLPRYVLSQSFTSVFLDFKVIQKYH